eukprot:2768985-Pyramimonas_sp.AAC.1
MFADGLSSCRVSVRLERLRELKELSPRSQILNAREPANRLYSKNNLWPGEHYDELLQKAGNNKTFVHSEAYKRLCAPSNGEARLTDQLLQDCT